MSRAGLVGAAAAALVLCAPGGELRAAPADDVTAWIKLVETQPTDMDKATWREKRREAAKKLGQAKDKRAVPVLMRVAEAETFDIVGENAIEALGALGDPQAVPLLQKIATDAQRDQGQRDLAKKALGRLGVKADGKAPPPVPPVPPPPTPVPTPPAPDVSPPPADGSATPPPAPAPPITEGKLLGGEPPPSAVPGVPVIGDDVLAASERVTFTAGNANLAYDTVQKRVDFDGTIGAAYAKRVEKPTVAYGYGGSANVVAGYINPAGAAESRGGEIDVLGDGEVRGYAGNLYGVGKAAVAVHEDYVSQINDDGSTAAKDTRFQGDLQVALGGGYGRVLDVGAAIRVRRLAAALQANRALGKPIDAALARKLQLTWWALRGEQTTYRALLATVAILREAGVLLGEPDAGTSYELLEVLRDSQLYQRPVGLDVQIAVGEGYLKRPDMAPTAAGRIEQALAAASYGKELADDKVQVTGTAFARLRLFASDGQPAPWAIGALARLQRFAYGEHGEPLGVLDASLSVALSDDDVPNGDPALGVTGALGFTYFMNQASGLRLAATATVDQGQLFLGAQFSATYALLDGTVAR